PPQCTRERFSLVQSKKPHFKIAFPASTRKGKLAGILRGGLYVIVSKILRNTIKKHYERLS
ncbi:MAG: hypothetical protein FWG66_08705, partial [Spirochaetes bacterium]|nr:hypothetical protein [Spirochaetota bacterium]